jgi:hypothetical protein
MINDIEYYIPEWDDQVSKHYDFWNDRDLSKKRVYSHELYQTPNYDGLLISRMKLEETKSKIEKIKEVGGVHNFYKFKGKIFGDCGAWGYYKEKTPPFKTSDIMDFYEELKFDIGVSIDHLITPEVESEKYFRQKLTIKNAEEFFNRHRSKEYSFTPVGVCQGWDIESYSESVQEIIDIGYNYIALGGIARAQTSVVVKILKSVYPLLKKKQSQVKLHLFGVARLEAIRLFRSLGVTSFDSASPIRSAWLGSKTNYRDSNWNGYSAIRLPFITRDKRFKDIINQKLYTVEDLSEKEENIKLLMYRFANENSRTPEEVTEAFVNLYNELIPETPDRSKEYLKTLRERPWEKCECEICRDVGMEVIIFRGNNRNRRRGFHNTYVFYKILKKLLHDPSYKISGEVTDKDFLEEEKKNIKALVDFL